MRLTRSRRAPRRSRPDGFDLNARLICGGGVVGVSIAYFLSRRGVRSTVIERTGLACAASGKGGGFLAASWSDGTAIEPLARRSFVLHAQLAEELGGGWGYRRMDTYGGASSSRRAGADGVGAKPSWLSASVGSMRQLGSLADTAQVHPRLYTEALMRAARSAESELRIGEVTGIALDASGSAIRGVMLGDELVEGDKVVIAMGPWSRLARRWLPMPDVYALKGHSLVFETNDDLPPEAVFLEHTETTGEMSSPEIFPRADGTTYICAINSDAPLPLDPADVDADEGALDRLQAIAATISPVLARSKVLARQACYRPVTRDGLPIIGALPGTAGAYVASGHSVWGILNAPATGEAIAELIVDGEAWSVPLAPFSPSRRRV